jgi:3-oxoacyl-[acyl-carrier protein] reductase
MNLGLRGKKALVTGGAQGIGEAIVKALADEGCDVFHTSRNRSGINTDLENFSSNGVDILVNNAGATLDIKDPHASTEDYRKVMRLNFEIPRELTEKALPHMKTKKWGRIVNITSCSGMENRGPVAFCCAKAALTAYTKSMGRVLAIEEPGIVMTAVYPGVVYTAGGHWEKILVERPEHWQMYKQEIPVGRFGEPYEIANQVVFLCSELASFHHGAIIGVDGGLSKGFAQHL